MRFIVFGLALWAVAAVGCEGSSIQDAPAVSEDAVTAAEDSTCRDDISPLAEALTTSADTGHCQVLHLFGSTHWVETGACIVSNGTQCQSGGGSACFKGRTSLNAIVGLRCVCRVDLTSRCSIPSASGRIAFVSDRAANDEIYVMNTDGTGVTRITRNSANDRQPAWSPDGSKIAFDSDRSGSFEIYVMKANGTGLTRLTNSLASETAPAWSPNGAKIAFIYRRYFSTTYLYVMSADGSGATRLTTGFNLAYKPAWSRTGKIAFDPINVYPNRDIFVVKADGSGLTQLTNNAKSDFYPAWSPDGTRLAFESDRDGDFEIFARNEDGTVSQLTHNSTFDGEPAWGP